MPVQNRPDGPPPTPAGVRPWHALHVTETVAAFASGAAWSPVSHLNAVCNSAELREAYESCLPALSAYATELGQNRELFQAYQALAASPAAARRTAPATGRPVRPVLATRPVPAPVRQGPMGIFPC